MPIRVRLLVLDHWSDWTDAQPDVIRGLTHFDRRALRDGEILTRGDGYLQVADTATLEETETPSETETEPTTILPN